ncbi:MAG: TadG family pilus assembly protein [Syntrophobacterales bacterium]
MPKTRNNRGSPGERGAITPVLAVCLAMALGFMAMTIVLGQLFVGKNELQNIADAAALAGAKKLIREDPPNSGEAKVFCSEAITTAQTVAAENCSFGDTMTVTAADVTLGQWDLATGTFTRTGCSTNPLEVTAIQVTVRRDGSDNPSLTTFFGGLLGTPQMNSSATAIAYLGLAGTASEGSLGLPFAVSSNLSGDFPGLSKYPGKHTPYARSIPLLDWFLPRPAIASDPQTFTWKDLGGSSLDTSRATFIMPDYSERTSLSKLQKYIKGPDLGGYEYPQVEVGQKVYPISEYRWSSNVYNNFNYLRNRYNAEKNETTGKWRVTAAVYYTVDPMAAAPPPPNSLLGLAQRLLPGPRPAYACASYTVPSVYVQGFVTLDVTKVICDKNDDGTWDSDCKYKSYPNEYSCYNKCYMEVEVPLDQNFVFPGFKTDPKGQSYHDMNPGASDVGLFASVPYLVK